MRYWSILVMSLLAFNAMGWERINGTVQQEAIHDPTGVVVVDLCEFKMHYLDTAASLDTVGLTVTTIVRVDTFEAWSPEELEVNAPADLLNHPHITTELSVELLLEMAVGKRLTFVSYVTDDNLIFDDYDLEGFAIASREAAAWCRESAPEEDDTEMTKTSDDTYL